ncbi:formyltetrahydrofolate deformylase, partial [Rhizobium ruizarguesonis]
AQLHAALLGLLIRIGALAARQERMMDVDDFHDSEKRMKVLLMVSHFGHCLNDLLYRWKIGELPIDIVGVVSNHFDYQKVVVNND